MQSLPPCRPGRTILLLWSLLAAAGGAVGCQAYNLEAVDSQNVIAVETAGEFQRSLPPSLLIVQDRSLSMEICFDSDTYGGETRGCFAEAWHTERDPSRRSRMEISQQVMESVVESNRDEVEFGLVLYGVDPDQPKIACAPPLVVAEPSKDSHSVVAEAYRSNPHIVSPAGGTPTTQALQRAYELLIDESGKRRNTLRQDYVVLVTDGLMNCNSAHPVPCICASETNCFGNAGEIPYGEEGNMDARQCLDDVDALSRVRKLKDAGIPTFVIGLGDVFSEDEVLAVQVLDELAEAGGVPQQGAAQKFYSAGNAEQLQTSLERIIAQIAAPCEYELDGPVCDGRLIKVNLSIQDEDDGSPAKIVETSCDEAAGDQTWFFARREEGGLDDRRITFSPALCERLSVAHQVKISIRGVENACSAEGEGPAPQPACSLADASGAP